jgi:hypothetical protein
MSISAYNNEKALEVKTSAHPRMDPSIANAEVRESSPNSESPLTALPSLKTSSTATTATPIELATPSTSKSHTSKRSTTTDMPPPKTPRRRKNTDAPLVLVPESSEHAVPTPGAAIEARNEKKLQDMLSRDSIQMTSATSVTFDDTLFETRTYDPSRKTDSVGSRSPKKKFLGVSVPDFLSSNKNVSEQDPTATFSSTGTTLSASSSAYKGKEHIDADGSVRTKAGLTHRRTDSIKKEEGAQGIKKMQDDLVSYLPSKVKEMKNLFDGQGGVSSPETPSKSKGKTSEKTSPSKVGFLNSLDCMGNTAFGDSPPLGYYNPPVLGLKGPMTRSVSDGVVEDSVKNASREAAPDDQLGRSKSMRNPLYEESIMSIPPTPLPKDTPQRVMLASARDKPARPPNALKNIFQDSDSTHQPTPVFRLPNYFNRSLVQQSPSIYSLHGEVHQSRGGLHSAGIIGHVHGKNFLDANGTGRDDTIQGRWSEGQVDSIKRAGKFVTAGSSQNVTQPGDQQRVQSVAGRSPSSQYSESVYSFYMDQQASNAESEGDHAEASKAPRNVVSYFFSSS